MSDQVPKVHTPKPQSPAFVDRMADLTFPRDGDTYAILWDEDGLFPVDTSDWPVQIKNERQLFIDDDLIASSYNLRRTVHQPRKHPANPILVPDQPWEGKMVIVGPVMRDPESGGLRMWYRSNAGEFPSPDGRVVKTALLYATSTDGIHWSKPALNIYPWKGFRATNILGAEMGFCGLFYEPDDPDRERRYKAIMGTRGEDTFCKGFYNLGTSPDGIHWTKHPERIVPMTKSQEVGYRGKQLGVGDTNSVTFDRKLGRYIWHTKVFIGGRRARAMMESDDLVHWTSPRVVMCADYLDTPDAQIYDMNPVPYESLWIAPLRVYHWKRFKRVEVQLAHSRDGRHFVRTAGRQVFLPLGAENDWDADYNVCATHFYVDMGDELWIYYTGSRNPARGHETWQHRIGLAIMQRDRFVSVDGPENEGGLTTRPLDYIGRTLHINANASGGQIRIAVLDADGRELTGTGFSDCIPMDDDSLDHVVTWKHVQTLDPHKHPRIRLRFRLHEAALFSFWIV